jgi:hypothetical protein
MGFKPQDSPEEQIKVTVLTEDSNFTAVMPDTSQAVVDTEIPEDFVKSSRFLGDNSLFVKYDFISDENQINDTPTTVAPEIVDEAFQTPIDINKSAGRDYNLDYVDNFLSLAEKNLTSQEYEDFIYSLPNQIKALFLYQSEFVKELKNITASDLIKNFKTQATMNVNYFKLVKIEILDGYDTSSDGQHMLSKPKFRILKEQDLDSIRHTTLCRFVRFYENNLKIKRDILSFPIERQYFFVSPAQQTTEETPVIDYTQKAKNIAVQHFISKDYDNSGITSNIIAQPEGTSYTKPNDGSGGFTRPNDGSGGVVDSPATPPASTSTTGGY